MESLCGDCKKYLSKCKTDCGSISFCKTSVLSSGRDPKRKTKGMPKEQRKYLKRSKKLLLAPYDSLKEEEKQAVDLILWYHEDLRKAYNLKERFYKIIRNKKKKRE